MLTPAEEAIKLSPYVTSNTTLMRPLPMGLSLDYFYVQDKILTDS